MANRFWVGNGGNWLDNTNHWSDSSGGAPGASLPSAADNVYFDVNSFSSANQTVTNDNNLGADCLAMDWTGATNTPTLAGEYGFVLAGSLTFIAAMIVTNDNVIRLEGTGNVTTNGLSIASHLYVVCTGTYTLQDDLTIAGSISHTAGTFATGNHAISCGGFTCNESTARTLTLGTSVITASSNITFTTTNLTMTANTSKFIMTGNTKTFAGGGVAFYDVEIQGTPTVISGSNTFHDLKLTAAKTVTFTAGTTQTLTTFSGDGASGSLITIQSSSAGSAFTISIATGTIVKYFYSIKDSTVAGGAGFNAVDSTNVSGNTGWTFYVATALVPTITYPTAETVVVNAAVTFTWTPPIGTQTHYDLDYSVNGVTWTVYANKVASGTASCIIIAGTFSSHIYYWRVRVYFIAGTVTSGYSQTSFVAAVNPVTTDVTCDLMPQPTIGWTASEQQAFQIKVGTYETGTVYSALGSYTVPYYFDDGTYGITVRTQNSLGIWSAWTAPAYFAIANVPGDAITLTTEQSGNAINLIWVTTGTYAKYYIYRDGVPIASVTDTAYADNFAFGTSVFKVRGILASRYYTMSNEETEALVLTFDMVSDIDTIIWLPLERSLGGPVSRAYSKNDDVTYLRFAGREYPVSAHSGFKNGRGNFNYCFKTRAEIEALMDLSGNTVIHKDTKGNRTIGIINDFSPVYTGKFYYSVSFTITQTDYNEAIEYD